MKLNPKSLEKLRELINEEIEYRSGPKIVSFFNNLGFNDIYGQGFPSRWMFTDEKLRQINDTPKLQECIQNLFNPINFIGKSQELDKFINDFNQYLKFDNLLLMLEDNKVFIGQLDEKNNSKNQELTEDDFLKQEFSKIDISKLGLDSSFEKVIQQRLDEIKKSLQSEASLSAIFLCGSTLEGLLLHVATQNPQKFNSSKSAPKDKDGKVKQLYDWTLDNLINVAHEENFIKLDIKKFTHTLKDFRNYIHPRQQASQNFSPDKYTAEISWKVLLATIANLTENRK
jgi:hypothetical protein